MANNANGIEESTNKWTMSMSSKKEHLPMPSFISTSALQTDATISDGFEQNVIVVDSNGDLNIDGLDPSLLKCVKDVIKNVSVSETERDAGKEQHPTTYIIDLSTFEPSNISCSDNFITVYNDSRQPLAETKGADLTIHQHASCCTNASDDTSNLVFNKMDRKEHVNVNSSCTGINTQPSTGLTSKTMVENRAGEKVSTDSSVTIYLTMSDQFLGTSHKNIKPELTAASLPSSYNSSDERSKLLSSVECKVSETGGNENSSDSYPSSSSSLPDAVIYKCSECEYSSHNKHYYKQHVDLVHNEERPFKCPHCDYAGKRRHALLEHMVVHSNQRPFTCDHCNASFRKKGHLTNHIKLHTSQKLVHCGVCNIQLPDSAAFEAHLRKIHNTDKLYKCKQCDYTVVDREVMLRHLYTHNEVKKCPHCSSVFNNEEGLISHVTSAHNVQVVKGADIRLSDTDPNHNGQKSFMIGNNKLLDANVPGVTKIICSECGFLCFNNETMQKHMWAHIAVKESLTNVTKPNEDLLLDNTTSLNSLGVLKKNVHLGQKTLPKDAVYQCTNCPFTSSDNSMFIKHMLAHKTQEKRLNQTKSETVDSDNELVVQTKYQGTSDTPKPDFQERKQSETGVPFIYDSVAARYRCIICGYHCEFQRTIKAHIWKHSGHKNIEYPTFDHTLSTPKSSSPPVQKFCIDRTPSVRTNDLLVGSVIRTHPPSTSVKHMTDLPSTVSSKQLCYNYDGSAVHVKKSASSLLENLAMSTAKPELSSQCITLNSAEVPSINFANLKMCSDNNAEINAISDDVNLKIPFEKVEAIEQGESMSSIDEGCTEPSVVVEVMDTVSSESGLTGMASQHGSPRILDFDGLSGDCKVIKTLSAEDKLVLMSKEIDTFKTTDCYDCNPEEKNHHYSVRLRCPICDRQVHNDFRSHLASCQKSKDGTLKPDHALFPRVDMESGHNEDTESAESSDELSSSTGSNQQKKQGICSSLLAVIEQLRERSRSESEEEKQGDLPFKKSSQEKNHLVDLDLDSIDEFHNIEKIMESGHEKYRCSLCHYTSQRICNTKLHMKTHRQKKPSECSLCDFSSSSLEALQEHMLKHCKVRTYACKFCPQSFNHKSTLRAHMRAHKDQEPFLCAYCVFESTNPLEYKEHMLVHSGCSSRLRCPGCELILNNKEELTVHLLKCKGGSKKSQLFTGSEGNFALKKDDKFHEKISDSPVHACVVSGCSYMTSSIAKLQDHLSVHCNPSLLVCNLCDFRALHSRSLKSHMKRHSNDQRYVQQPLEQYKCNLCGYVCHHLPSLKSHMWRHASDQSYSYEFTNDVINAAIDHDTRVEADGEPDDPELLDRVINSERRILEGELNKCNRGDGQRPICWVTFRCCSCGFETINKAKLNIHMRAHSDIIQQALDLQRKSQPSHKSAGKRLLLSDNSSSQLKVAKMAELV